MELAGIVRVLWRHRIKVGVGGLVAIAVGVLSVYQVTLAPPSFQSRQTTSGSATVRLLVDTPSSLVAAARPLGYKTISIRAALLGNLIASDNVRSEIARAARLRPPELAVVGPGLSVPAAVTALSQNAVDVVRPAEAHVVTVSMDPEVPIISILAEAPDPGAATVLADAASTELGSLAQRAKLGGANALRTEQIGPAKAEQITDGPGRAAGLVMTWVVFALWCAAVVIADGIRRRRVPAHAFAPWQQN